MKNDHMTSNDYPTFLDDVAIHRSNADIARGEVLIAGWNGLVNLFRSAAARISRVNRVTNNSHATA